MLMMKSMMAGFEDLKKGQAAYEREIKALEQDNADVKQDIVEIIERIERERTQQVCCDGFDHRHKQ